VETYGFFGPLIKHVVSDKQKEITGMTKGNINQCTVHELMHCIKKTKS
jgi:hypothetical protein